MDLCDEAFYFRENGVLIAHENQVIVARQFNQLRVRNVRRNVTPFFDTGISISRAMEDERRYAYGRQNMTHVNRGIQPRQRQRGARAGAAPLITRPPASETFVIGHAWRQ